MIIYELLYYKMIDLLFYDRLFGYLFIIRIDIEIFHKCIDYR